MLPSSSLETSSLLPENARIKTYTTIVLAVVLCACKFWSPMLREEHGLRLFENWVLRKIFISRSEEARETGRNCTIS
jgi:hypothetical protein